MLTLDPRSVPEGLASIVSVGDQIGVGDFARARTDRLQSRLDALARAIDGASRPSVLVLEWTDPPFTAGHWVPDIVTAGGGTAVLADPGRDSRRVDADTVRTAAAEVVLVAPCGYHLDAAADLGGALVAAGVAPVGAAVWAVDADSYFVRPGPRVVDGAEIVARILHPDRVGEPDPATARRLR